MFRPAAVQLAMSAPAASSVTPAVALISISPPSLVALLLTVTAPAPAVNVSFALSPVVATAPPVADNARFPPAETVNVPVADVLL